MRKPILGVRVKMGGELIVIGTCVFWDNYSIDLKDNRVLALDLLTF